MKIKFLITLVPLLIGCAASNNSINIICPKGAPSIAFYKYSDKEYFETNSQPNNIVSFMNEKSNKNVVILDTVSGIKAIQTGSPFKIAATITFGNFYICKTKKELSNEFADNCKIVIFGKNQTPDLLFHFLYESKYDNNIIYVNSLEDAQLALSEKKYNNQPIDYVFIAEPAMNRALEKNKNASIVVNIQQLYKEKTKKEIIQASIFIKNSDNKVLFDDFLLDLKNDIEIGLSNNNKIIEGMDKLGKDSNDQIAKFGATSTTISKILPNNTIGLGFKYSYSIKEDIDYFIKLFNMEGTNEEIYYK